MPRGEPTYDRRTGLWKPGMPFPRFAQLTGGGTPRAIADIIQPVVVIDDTRTIDEARANGVLATIAQGGNVTPMIPGTVGTVAASAASLTTLLAIDPTVPPKEGSIVEVPALWIPTGASGAGSLTANTFYEFTVASGFQVRMEEFWMTFLTGASVITAGHANPGLQITPWGFARTTSYLSFRGPFVGTASAGGYSWWAGRRGANLGNNTQYYCYAARGFVPPGSTDGTYDIAEEFEGVNDAKRTNYWSRQLPDWWIPAGGQFSVHIPAAGGAGDDYSEVTIMALLTIRYRA